MKTVTKWCKLYQLYTWCLHIYSLASLFTWHYDIIKFYQNAWQTFIFLCTLLLIHCNK